MEIPSFGGMNSIVGKEVNELDLINVATMALIPGTASKFRSGEKWIYVTGVVYQEIGGTKAEALIGFHCFSGCDTVETFSGKSKAKLTTVFLKSPPNIITAFSKLCDELVDDILSKIEIFTAGVYNSQNKKPQALEVWSLLVLRELRRKHKYSHKRKGMRNVFELMPPTSGAFLQHVRRSHVVAKTLSQ